MKNEEITDPLFREVVEAIDAGNITALETLVTKHPGLVCQPLLRPSGDYFNNPYLLWFVAYNPIRVKTMPPNIVDIARVLVQVLRKEAPESMQHQLDYALGLVATGYVPRECGVQIAMMDLLIDAGAKPGSALGALAHSNAAAAAHLVERGSTLTLATAVGLNWMDDVVRLLADAKEAEQLTALTVAAFYGNVPMLQFLLDTGVTPNGYPQEGEGFHRHGTPLHQAVSSGSLECVKLLVEAGANLYATDKVYSGTSLGWAMYIPTEEGQDEAAKKRFAEIENYLREREEKAGISVDTATDH